MQSVSEREFLGYLERWQLGGYHCKFVEHGLADMRFLSVLEAKDLSTDIGMGAVHVKYFMAKAREWKEQRTAFRQWMADIHLFAEYHEVLESHGVYHFESFYRIVRSVEDLKAIIGADNAFDAALIWRSTPKQARKQQNEQMQPEGL